MPGDGSLLAPDWVPWSERLEAGEDLEALEALDRLCDDADDLDDDDLDDDHGDDPDDGIDFEQLSDLLALGEDEQNEAESEADDDGPEPPLVAAVKKRRQKKQQARRGRLATARGRRGSPCGRRSAPASGRAGARCPSATGACGCSLSCATTQSIARVRVRTSSGSIAVNVAMRSWLRPSLRYGSVSTMPLARSVAATAAASTDSSKSIVTTTCERCGGFGDERGRERGRLRPVVERRPTTRACGRRPRRGRRCR